MSYFPFFNPSSHAEYLRASDELERRLQRQAKERAEQAEEERRRTAPTEADCFYTGSKPGLECWLNGLPAGCRADYGLIHLHGDVWGLVIYKEY